MVVAQLAACGGGGGTAGTSTTGTTGTTGTGTTGTTATPAVPTAAIAVTLVDPTTGAAKTAIAVGDSAMALATVTTDLSGVKTKVVGALVSFVIKDSALATISPVTAIALTDANGIARVRLDAASFSTAGATTVTATSTFSASFTSAGVTTVVPFNAITGSVNFAINAVAVTLSNLKANLTAPATTLSAYATTTISVVVGGVPTTTPVTVSFSSTCASANKATIGATGTSANGIASVTYVDKGCSTTDTITASAQSSSNATLALPVSAPAAGSVQFVSATPSLIVLKGTGGSGLVENSLVKFKLVDTNGQAIAGQSLNLSLTTVSGGILLDGVATALTKQTDSLGEVSVSVSSGTVPTPVWVNAAYVSGATTFTTQSVKIQIATGRPVQDRFSLSVGTRNIEGLNSDGVQTDLTVIASDRVGNPVPDGTAINFISNGGQIGTGSSGACSTTGGGGSCSVKFTSANPRPAGGGVVITAYAIGEESFRDDNGNNVHDATEPYGDMGDLFLDVNLNGTRDTGEQSISFGPGGLSCANGLTDARGATTDFAPSGTTRPPMTPTTCDQTWGAAHVRATVNIVLSGKDAVLVGSQALTMGSSCTSNFNITLQDVNGNAMPFGTTLTIGNITAQVSAPPVPPATTTTISTPTIAVSPASVGNQTGPSQHILTVTTPGTTCPLYGWAGGFVLTVKTPLNNSTLFGFSIAP